MKQWGPMVELKSTVAFLPLAPFFKSIKDRNHNRPRDGASLECSLSPHGSSDSIRAATLVPMRRPRTKAPVDIPRELPLLHTLNTFVAIHKAQAKDFRGDRMEAPVSRHGMEKLQGGALEQ
jgi:hypothetical protein